MHFIGESVCVLLLTRKGFAKHPVKSDILRNLKQNNFKEHFITLNVFNIKMCSITMSLNPQVLFTYVCRLNKMVFTSQTHSEMVNTKFKYVCSLFPDVRRSRPQQLDGLC
jgi:hypothetical protein